MKRRPLLREEVPKDLREFIDFDCQYTHLGLTHVNVICPDCGNSRSLRVGMIRDALHTNVWTAKCVRCSMRYTSKKLIRNWPRWKGGRRCHVGTGYILRHRGTFTAEEQKILGPMFYTDGRKDKTIVLEHRALVALALGRPLTTKEAVHHVNGHKADNRLGNLRLVTHHKESVCPRCGWPMEFYSGEKNENT